MRKINYRIFLLFIILISVLLLYFNCSTESSSSGGGGSKTTTVTYNLRNTGPAGGLIFYINPNYETDGWHYLEAAPLSTEWANKEWGAYGTLISGTGIAIGNGKNNTTIVATWLDNNSETDRAAQLCNDLEITNGSVIYDDWFLPSCYELAKMYVNLKSGTDENGVIYTPVGNFADNYYWSSSEYEAEKAYGQRFFNGVMTSPDKNENIVFVRAVRAF